MADLDAVPATDRGQIGCYLSQGIGEQDTRATRIVPVLCALGRESGRPVPADG